MEDTETTFQKALAYIKSGKGEGKEPNNTQRLQFYALFKQVGGYPIN